MGKTLVVMRHAKSDWDFHGDDFERPLNARGRTSATALGKWLKAQQLSPDEVLCSSAARTQETAQRLRLATPATLKDGLYLASADTILKHIRRASGDTLLLIAHNPGISEFVERLAQDAPDHPRFFDYPTGASTVFSCPCKDWRDLAFRTGTVNDFVIPRELP